MQIEFAPPVGYVEPDYKKMAEESKVQITRDLTSFQMRRNVQAKSIAASPAVGIMPPLGASPINILGVTPPTTKVSSCSM